MLEGVALSIEAGERIALVGRNGAAKGCQLKILVRLDKPDDCMPKAPSGLWRVYGAQAPRFGTGA